MSSLDDPSLFEHLPALVGRHVALEPMETGHLGALITAGADPGLWALTIMDASTPEGMRQYVAEALAARVARTALPFVVRDLAADRIIGSTRLGSIVAADLVAEIGWTWYMKEFQGGVVNPECKLLLMTLAFDELGCERIELKTDARNARSRAAMLKLGAVEEGTLRSKTITQAGRRRDSVFFSVLRAEWPAVKRGLERRVRG